jgi:hypothetical protein
VIVHQSGGTILDAVPGVPDEGAVVEQFEVLLEELIP